MVPKENELNRIIRGENEFFSNYVSQLEKASDFKVMLFVTLDYLICLLCGGR